MAADPDLDDVAFLSGACESSGDHQKKGVAVCSQKRAICVTALVLGSLLLTALIIAYAGPQNDCSCAGKMPPDFEADDKNSSLPFYPISTNGEPFPWIDVRLPTFVKPLKYLITIHPNLTTLDVKGQVTIELLIEKETNFIVMNVQELNITEKAIIAISSKSYAIKITKILEYPPRQQLYIEVKEKLKKKANYTINLRWYSKLSSDPHGFYVDQYESSNGLQRSLAATAFKPGGARRAFPCFDEPHLRAPFRVSVFRDRFHIGLSNSIVHTTEDVGFYMGTGLLRDDFLETPPIPADAIAWVVIDFQGESLQPSTSYEILATVTPSSIEQENVTTVFFNSIAQKSNKKPPVRNITALTHSLNSSVLGKNSTHTISNKTKIRDTPHNANNIKNGPIQTAPIYTFYAPRELIFRTNFILKMAREVLEHLQNWLEVAYPLTKVDFIALPTLDRDMISSLGVIILRTSFLSDSSIITTKDYHLSAIKIAQAVVKQFFGGITSPETLKDNWLWDGLVKYLGIHSLALLQSKWPLGENHLLHISTTSLDIDGNNGWDSIVNGTSLDGNNEDFYIDKTAALFSMLHTAIGEDRFKKCLGTFLKLNKFKTADVPYLWDVCAKKSNGSKNIREMMFGWTHQPGFPLLTLKKDGTSISISQEQFQLAEFSATLDENTYSNNNNGSIKTFIPKTTNNKRTKWIVPIDYVTDNKNVTGTVWMHTSEITFKVPENVKWIKINSRQHGYYRALYNPENWANMIQDLRNNHNHLTSKDRTGLLSDAFTLCHANLMSCEITMNLLNYLPNESNWGPMTIALRYLERWRRILKYSECFLMLSEFIKIKLNIIIEKIGWNDEGDVGTRLMRPEILLSSVLWEDADSITKAKLMLSQFLFNNGSSIPPNLKEVVYTGSVLSGEYIYWQHCWERFISLRDSSEGLVERMQLLRALGRTKDAWLQNRLLSHVTLLPVKEVIEVLRAIAGTPTGGAMACRFLQAKWLDLQSRLGEGSVVFAKVISAITQYGATKFDYDELQSLFNRFGRGPGAKILNMTLSNVGANVEWVSRSQSSLYGWIENNLHVQ